MKQIRVTINGQLYEASVRTNETLLDFLRDNIGLTGTKKGCDTGECGACTVLFDGEPVDSCLVLAIEADGREITTIEGLAHGTELDPLQKAFIAEGAVQCGYCTPGMIVSAKALLNRNSHPAENEIREAISGNLCRCTGYVKIIQAIQLAARGGN